MKNENTWTQGGEHYTQGPRGEIALGEIPHVDDGLMGAQTTMAYVHLCNKSAHSAHVSQNLKYNSDKI